MLCCSATSERCDVASLTTVSILLQAGVWLLCASTSDHRKCLLFFQPAFCCTIQGARTLQLPMSRSFQSLLPRSVLDLRWWRRERDPQCLSHSLWDFTFSKNSNSWEHHNLARQRGRCPCHSRFKHYHSSWNISCRRTQGMCSWNEAISPEQGWDKSRCPTCSLYLQLSLCEKYTVGLNLHFLRQKRYPM